ncbi:MAG: hypothetical protein DCC67_02555 [Planctomycetota bacterium]|nr:MAG: hypothetical protein DCC67_02555 [Planctomycetota bacterium]
MARKYAAIMASLGMTLVLLRALRHGGGLDAIPAGVAWMVAFGLVGYILGAIARTTVDESVRLSMQHEIGIASGQHRGPHRTSQTENGFSHQK